MTLGGLRRKVHGEPPLSGDSLAISKLSPDPRRGTSAGESLPPQAPLLTPSHASERIRSNCAHARPEALRFCSRIMATTALKTNFTFDVSMAVVMWL